MGLGGKNNSIKDFKILKLTHTAGLPVGVLRTSLEQTDMQQLKFMTKIK